MTNPNRRVDPPYTRLKKCLDNVSHRTALAQVGALKKEIALLKEEIAILKNNREQ
jgi:uncharacterized small protein (DUF1192 family)